MAPRKLFLVTDQLVSKTKSTNFAVGKTPDLSPSKITNRSPLVRTFVAVSLCLCGILGSGAPAYSQVPGNPLLAPITLNSPQIAQVPRGDAVNPTIIPTDVTPIGIGRERELQRPGMSFYLFQKLPPKLWFNATTEVTQRLETNVLFTQSNPRPDYVFRVQPNITLGYKVLPRTSVYANYFLIKDVFADNGRLTYPTFQSVSGGLLHDIPIKSRSNLQLQWQFRELWQSAGIRQADMIPGLTFTHAFTPRLIGFANLQLQLRSRDLFITGGLREIDPFYTLGLLYRIKRWNFVATNTFVSNYRNQNAIIPQNNMVMISDFEVSHPVSKKIPSLVAFVRAEPIFNWASRGVPGLSGFDFRLFSGLRWNVSKNAYDTELSKLRKYLKNTGSGQGPNNPNDPNSPAGAGAGGGSGDGDVAGPAGASVPNSNALGSNQAPNLSSGNGSGIAPISAPSSATVFAPADDAASNSAPAGTTSNSAPAKSSSDSAEPTEVSNSESESIVKQVGLRPIPADVSDETNAIEVKPALVTEPTTTE